MKGRDPGRTRRCNFTPLLLSSVVVVLLLLLLLPASFLAMLVSVSLYEYSNKQNPQGLAQVGPEPPQLPMRGSRDLRWTVATVNGDQ